MTILNQRRIYSIQGIVMRRTSKNGFTLIELSIVLVIIGLLIGGILVAQSMIDSSKIQAFVRQLGQFDTAIVNFKTKFNQLPGDTNLIGSGGDNDGYIETNASGNYTGEIGKFWNDLSTTETIASTPYPARSYGSGAVVAGDVPTLKIGQNAGITVISMLTGYLYTALVAGRNTCGLDGPCAPYYNTFVIGNGTVGSGAGVFKPAEALAIEIKLGDDGNAMSGFIHGRPSGSNWNFDLGDSGEDGECLDSGFVYKVSTSYAACTLNIKVAINGGL